MLHCEFYNPDTGTIETVPPDGIGALLTRPDAVLWIDVQRPTVDELGFITDTFHIHHLAMEDVRNQRQRSKVDRYSGYYFVVLRTIHFHARAHKVDSHQVNIFVGSNYLITIHQGVLPELKRVHKQWEKHELPFEAIPFLFYLIADTIVDSYFPILDAIGEYIDTIDTATLTKPTKETLQSIFTLRRGLLNIRKILGPLRDVFNELLRADYGIANASHPDARVYFNDIYDHILRLTDFVDTYRDMLSGSLEAYQSSLSNQLNSNMQRLTVAATVLATGAVVTGFFGMNLRGLMVNSGWRYGGHAVFGLLIIIMAIEIYIFWRKGWL